MTITARQSTGIAVLNIISCLAVVCLHSGDGFWLVPISRRWDGYLVVQILFRYGVPCFFMITGAMLMTFTESYGIGTFVKKRLGKILIPFLLWTEIFTLWNMQTGKSSFRGWKTFVLPVIDNSATFVYWYFYAIFGIYAFLPFVSLALEGRTQRFKNALVGFLGIVFFSVDWLIPFLRDNGVPITVAFLPPFGTGYFVFCCLGYLLFANPLPRWVRWLSYGSGVVAGLLFYWVTWSQSHAQGSYVGIYMRYDSPLGILCAVPIFIACLYFPWERLGGGMRGGLRTFSGLTYGIYLVHIMVMYYFNELLAKSTADIWALRWFPCRVIVVFCGAALIIWLIKKIPKLGSWIVP